MNKFPCQMKTQVVSLQKIDFIRNKRAEKERLLKKCGVILPKMTAVSIVRRNGIMYKQWSEALLIKPKKRRFIAEVFRESHNDAKLENARLDVKSIWRTRKGRKLTRRIRSASQLIGALDIKGLGCLISQNPGGRSDKKG